MAFTFTPNDSDQATDLQGVEGGYLFFAPAGTALPTGHSDELNPAFKCLGFISEDGWTFADDIQKTVLRDVNGDEVNTIKDTETHTMKVRFLEMTRKGVQEVLFGSDNVTSSGGTMTVEHADNGNDRYVFVSEMLTLTGKKWRCVIPSGKTETIGEFKAASGEVGRECTIKAYKTTASDGSKVAAIIDYIEE